eukprot:756535-Hanusia_phi.AAC.2
MKCKVFKATIEDICSSVEMNGIPIQKRVRCKFSIKKQKLGRFQSALCEQCKKYACVLCEDIATCSKCAISKWILKTSLYTATAANELLAKSAY